MAIANVQIKSGIADDTASISITPDSNVTAGNLLIVYAMKYSPSDADVFVAGDLSKSSGTATIGTVTLDVQNLWDAGSDGVMAGMYSVPVTGTGSLTLQLTGDSGCSFFIVVQEVSGADTSASRVAGTNSAPDTSSPYDSGTVALTGGGIFATCLATYSLFSLTFTPDAAFTLAAEQEDGDHMTGAAAYRIVTGSTTDSGTFTSSANDDGVIVLAVYKESSGAATLTVSVSDAVSVSESANVAVETSALTVNLSDAVGVTDTPSAVLPDALGVGVSDSITVGESSDVALESAPADLNVSVSDTVYVIEPTFVGFETPAVSVSDGVTVGESVSVSMPDVLVVSVSDAVTVTESISAEVVTTIAASEAVGVSESTSVSLPDALALAVSEAVSVSESVAVEPVTANVSLSEGVTVAEGVEAVLPDALVVDVSDGVTVTESASVNLPIAGTYTVNVNESIVTAESVSLTVSAPQVGAADTVGVAESAGAEVGGPQVNVSDAVTVWEGVALFVNEAGALGVNVSDGASLAEAVTLALNTLVIASQESIGLSEAASVLVMGSVIGGDATVAFSRASATTGIAKATASVEVK